MGVSRAGSNWSLLSVLEPYVQCSNQGYQIIFTIIQIDTVFSKYDVFSLLSGCKNYISGTLVHFHCKQNGKKNGKRSENPLALPPTPDLTP